MKTPFHHQHDSGHPWYRFPTLGGVTVRVARHQGGEATTPDSVDRECHHEELAAFRQGIVDVAPSPRAAPALRAPVGWPCSPAVDGDPSILCGEGMFMS